jgi:hypothetical protein
MVQFVQHFQNGFFTRLQREDAVVPEVVSQCLADVEQIELVLVVLVGERLDDVLVSVTDDRRVVSDCVDIIEVGSRLVPVSVD